jgi:hypothetical protein
LIPVALCDAGDAAVVFDEEDVTPSPAQLADAFPDADLAESRSTVQRPASRLPGNSSDRTFHTPPASVDTSSARNSARPIPRPHADGST